MIQEEFQDSDSSSNGNSELVIKPPQSLSLSSSIFCQNEKKKRRHSKDHKSNKRHHHSHRDGHIKSLDVDSRKRNQNDTEIKRKDQSKKPKMSSRKEDVRDTKSKKMLKNIAQEITDVRQVRTNTKDVRESKSFNYRNEDRSTYFLEEMKIEWRHKRLQWLQHQKKQNEKLQIEEKTGLQGTKSNGELSEQHKNIMTDYSQSKMSSTECFQFDHEINYSITSPEISSEEENTDYREDTKSIKLIDVENERLTEQENTTSVSDTSNDNDSGHNAASKKSEGNVETESISENEKIISQKESLHTELVGEATSTAIFVKENLDAKLMGKNEISVISSEKCPSLASTSKTHPPKLPVYCPAIQGCRSIDGFQILNRIEEGTYGVVYRAKDKETKEIVALKRLKMEREKEGFPITSLREINTLLKAQHPNIVTVREIVVGSNMDRIYIVMDYVEHDLKSLMKTMPRPFLIGEVKTLLMQLLCAVAHLHDNWILHRDLKTSNLLLSHQGILKVGDFGLAREYGSPLKSYTPVVVTLWYRAPELLLGAKKYSTSIDMWSVGCIFGELLTKNALFPGKSESDQLNRIFKDLGTPSENIWPGYSELPLVQSINITQYPYNVLKNRFSHTFTDLGFDLLNKFLTYNPARRISAENAKNHEYFSEKPKPIPPNMFPIWPAKSERQNRTARSSPKPPLGGMHYSRQ